MKNCHLDNAMQHSQAAVVGTLRWMSLAVLLTLVPVAALAQVTFAPQTATAQTGGTSEVVTATIIYNPPAASGTGTLDLTNALPPGVTTSPTLITFDYFTGAGTAITTFRYVVGAAAAPGLHQIPIKALGVTCGPGPGPCTGIMDLRIVQTGFSVAVSPNPVTLQIGGAPQAVSVQTIPATGLIGQITYDFIGLPTGVAFGGTQSSGTPYPPLNFPFAAATGTSPGTYAGTLTASLATVAGPPVLRTAPITVIVQRPDLLVSFTQPSMSLCDGGPAAANTVMLQPAGGYTGTPQLIFTAVPSGITVTPLSPVSPALPPGASIPFTVAAAGASPGVHPIFLRVQDAAAAIDKTVSLNLNVTAQDFNPTVAPASLTVQAGGAPATFQALVGPNSCFAAPDVTVSVTGQPVGLTVSPAPTSVKGPAYPPATLTVTAQPTTTPGTHILTVAFSAGADIVKTATLAVIVTPPPNFTLAVVPPALSLQAGTQAQVTVTSSALNGLAATVNVTAAAPSPITVEPATFTLPATGSQTVTVRAPESAAAGGATVRFDGTAAGVVGPRSATLALTLTPAPPTIRSITPPALAAGASEVILRLTGERFRPGARVASSSPSVVIDRTTFLSTRNVDVVVSVLPSATPGSYRLDLVNNDGTSTAAGIPVLVYPTSSLGAPLGVSAAAVVHPLPFTLISEGDQIVPRGLLATTGVGTIVGSWQLDGFPFDRFTVQASGGMPVEVPAHAPIPVTFIGEHRLELVIEQPRSLVSAPITVVQAAESRTRLRLLEPGPDGPRRLPEEVRWSLVPGASGFVVEVATNDGEIVLRRRLSESSWRPTAEDLAELGSGEFLLRVRAVFPGEVLGEPTLWRTVEVPGEASSRRLHDGEGPAVVACALDVDQEESPPSMEGEASTDDATRDLDLALMATIAGENVEQGAAFDAARAQASTVFEASAGSFSAKGTGDLSARQDLEPPHDSANESRSWDLLLAAGDERYRAEARGGYSPPDFLDQTEMLAVGLARRGVSGKAVTPVGALSYYRTIDDLPVGYGYSPFITPTDIEAAGWELPGSSQRLLLRAFVLRAESDPKAESKSKSEAVGVFGSVTVGASQQVVFELARARLKAGDDPSQTGDAFRVGVTGSAGRISYSLNARKTDAEFYNPVNPGFTYGAVSDRVGGDLSLSTTVGSASLSLQARRFQSGGGDSGPKNTEDNGTLSLFMPLSARVSLQSSATLTKTDGEADDDHGLPAADRIARGLSATVSETIGAASLSQGVFWQDTEDRALPGSDQEVVGVTLNGSVSPGPALFFNGMVSATRTDLAAELGRTDQLMLSLQGTWTMAGTNLALTPRGTYSRSKNSEPAMVSESEQYQLVMQWTPPWLGQLLAFEVAADFSRFLSSYSAGVPPFARRLTASLTLRHSAKLPQPGPPLPDPRQPPGGDPLNAAWRL